MALRIALAAVMACIFALPAAANGNKPHPLDLSGAPYGMQAQSWIEQQDDWPQPADFIRNPFSGICLWSVGDYRFWHTTGYLDPGNTVSANYCIVSDFNPVQATRQGITASWSMARYGFFGVAVSPSMTGMVCYQPQGRCFSFSQSFCGRANYRPDDPALADIADSHGGRGVVTSITLTLTNPTARRIRDVDVQWGFSSDVAFPAGCAVLPPENEYPFAWQSS